MQVWSNDAYESVEHRVVVNSDEGGCVCVCVFDEGVCVSLMRVGVCMCVSLMRVCVCVNMLTSG